MKKEKTTGKIIGIQKDIIKTQSNKIIIGIDPGLKVLGIGIVEINLSNTYSIETHKKKGIISSSLIPLIENYDHFFLDIKANRKIEEKLFYIFETINNMIIRYTPDMIIIEDSFVGFNKNSSIKLALARGSILTAIGQNKTNCEMIPPSLIKMILTQKGNASKEDISDFFKEEFKDWQEKSKFDSSDALAAAFCGIKCFL